MIRRFVLRHDPTARIQGLRACLGLAILALVLATFAGPGARAQGPPPVLLATLSGEIGRTAVDFVVEALDEGQRGGYGALVLQLDTPGGGLAETLEIRRLLFGSSLPVIGYVGPAGASAFSAGTIILESTDFAAMAPATTIGSVQPVVVGPTGIEPVTDEKVVNAIVEILNESLVQHGRNASLARRFVVDNLNLGAAAALSARAIEAVAPSVADLLVQADGRTTVFKGITLTTAGAPVVAFTPSLRNQVLGFLSDPLVSSLLLVLGIYAFIFGVSAPGHGSEILGVILIVLGLIGLGFSVSPLALLLIVLGVAFLVVELKTPGFGVFGTAGIAAIVLGAFFLAPLRPPEFVVTPEYQLTFLAALLTPTAVLGGFLLFALFKVIQIRKKRPAIGTLVGEEAQALDPIDSSAQGYVLYRGEMWLAKSAEPIAPGERVVIESKEGPLLTVRKRGASAPPVTP